MQQAIRNILNDIPSGCVFDSHFVIARLIKLDSNAYLNFASSINASSDKTLAVHGKIGQEIARHEGNLIQRLSSEAWSENIHGNASKCTGWQKK